MRADSHYVEEFDSTTPTQIIRVLPIDRVQSGDASDEPDKPVDPALVESVREHGILQPLLVRQSRGAYRLIAGHRRLAAAAAAGLSTVPCIVHHVDEQEAEKLAAASNPAVQSRGDGGAPFAANAAASTTAAELSRALARISSCTGLLESPELAQQVLSGLVRVEACRAWCLAQALTVLSGTSTPRTARTPAKAIGRRVMERCEAERRVRSVAIETKASVRDATDIMADADLLVAVLTGMVLASLERHDVGSGQAVKATLTIDVKSGNQVAFGVAGFQSAGDHAPAPTPFASVMRLAAERVAEMLGGRVAAAVGHDAFAIELPLAQLA